jgi:hypothetical protein
MGDRELKVKDRGKNAEDGVLRSVILVEFEVFEAYQRSSSNQVGSNDPVTGLDSRAT